MNLPSWITVGPGPFVDAVKYVCQIAPGKELFRRESPDGQEVRGLVIYDKAARQPRYFAPPVSVWEALWGYLVPNMTLRRDGTTEGWFFSDGTTQFRFLEGNRAKSLYFYEGTDKESHRRTIRIGSFFVTEDRILVVEPDRGRLLSLAKRAVLRAFGETPDHGDWTPLDINLPDLDHQLFLFDPPEREAQAVLSSFDEDAIYFAASTDSSRLKHLRIQSFDLKHETLRQHECPLLYRTDLRYLCGLIERRPARFGTYLDAVQIVSSLFDRLFEKAAGPELLWLEGHIIGKNVIIDLRLEDADGAGPVEDGTAAAGNLRDVYSPLPSDQRRGVVEFFRSLHPLEASSFESFLVRRYSMDELASIFEPELAGPEFQGDYFTRIAHLLYRYPEHIELGKRWLEGGPTLRWAAVGLLEGLVSRPRVAAILSPRHEEDGPKLGDFREVYVRSEDIPLEAVRGVAEGALAAAEAESAGRGIMDPSPGSNITLNLIQRIMTTAVSWQTEQGMEIVREMASRGIPEVDVQIAEIIRDRRLSGLKDIAFGYLGHGDALVVKTAIAALRELEERQAEDRMIGLLGASDRVITVAATKWLGNFGTAKSLAPLSYADIIECLLDEMRLEGDVEGLRNPKTRSFAKAAIDEIMGRLGMDLERDTAHRSTDQGRGEHERIFAENTILNCYRDACRNYSDSQRPAGNRRFRTESHLETIDELEDLAGLRERLTAASLMGLFPRRPEKNRQVLEFLRWHLESGGEDDTIYLAALIFHLTPKYLNLDRRGPVTSEITVSLKIIYERMREKRDFRGTLAVLGLLELGLDRKWERLALEAFDRADWRGWPRLMRVGIHALRYRPDDEKLKLCEMLLRDICGGPGYEETLFDIAKRDPMIATRLYEQGGFKLPPLKAGLLYGMAADLRGYQDILNAPPEAHNRSSVEFLRKHGGPEATEVIEKALFRWQTPADVVDRVIKDIQMKQNRKGR